MHTCAHVRATGGCWPSSLSLYTYSLETVSLTRPFIPSLDDSQQALGTFLPPLHPSTEVMAHKYVAMFGFSHGCQGSDAFPHALTTSTLSSAVSYFPIALVDALTEVAWEKGS